MRRINILTWFCLIMTFALTTLGSQAKEVHETAYLEHNSDFITIKFESINPRLLTNKKILVLLILNTPYDVQLKTYEIALKPILRRQFVSIPLQWYIAPTSHIEVRYVPKWPDDTTCLYTGHNKAQISNC